MKRGIKSFGFFAFVIIFGIILITLIVDRADAQNGSDWVSKGALNTVASDTESVITFPLEPLSKTVNKTIRSVLAEEYKGRKIEIRKRRTVTMVNPDPIVIKREGKPDISMHRSDCEIGPWNLDPDGGYIQERGVLDGYILYEYTNRGEYRGVGMTCPTTTLFMVKI